MYRLVEVLSPEDRQRFCALPGLTALTPEGIARHCPDALWMLADRSDAIVARAALWWHNTPPYQNHRLGLIGHYAVTEAEAAAPLLQRACDQLAGHGCTLAVGPMDGNTWQRYRLLSERGSEPVFFLEPDNPDDWPAHFTDNGFNALAHYCSALNTDLQRQDPRLAETGRRLEAQEVAFRPLNPARFEDELRRIHALSLESFRNNFLYTPIGEDDFLAQYRGLAPYVRPELVLLAEQQGHLLGYIFAIPDLLQAKRGQPVDTVIVKTMAVQPAHAGAGLGGLLMARCHEAAARLGYTRAIHALFHEDNPSGKISRHTARVIRRYTLFAKPLGQPS